MDVTGTDVARAAEIMRGTEPLRGFYGCTISRNRPFWKTHEKQGMRVQLILDIIDDNGELVARII